MLIEAKGHNGQVTFDGATVTISRKGGLARLTVGKGSKAIPVQHITAVQMKQATSLVNGFIQFSIPGGNERRSGFGTQTAGAVADENSVLFRKSQMADFERLRDAVQDRISGGQAPSPAARVDVADQLTKLAALRDSGVLSDAEFDAEKAKLLGL